MPVKSRIVKNLLIFSTLLISLFLSACLNNQQAPASLLDAFTGNTLVGDGYATYFPNENIAVMNWQGTVSTRTWWIDKQNRFCHSNGEKSVCEEVKRLDNKRFEFCGSNGCFPATLEPGNSQGLIWTK